MNPYFEQKILSVDPIELIRLVYQRARSSVADAREHLRNKRIPGALGGDQSGVYGDS